ncbi:class I adenylate-forming enzyme family protein [Tardiphaga sp. OK245]|uniref:class I adenylate-forming enzyme family protein n=1 Tax=Tardiphaga sp. OK245 TaxID=1855306 RepID=UPI000B8767FE|nr:class I adenylate-forming enzyme family protein [Tardiphaga sp. OK245]
MTSRFLTLHDPSSARRHYASGLWADDTLYMMAACHAAERPDAYAAQDRRHRLTWKELVQWADIFAGELHESGLTPGERVAVWLPNRVEILVALLACSRNGYVALLSLHQNHTVAEVASLLERFSVRTFLTSVGYGADSGQNNIFARLPQIESIERVYALPPIDAADTPKPDQTAEFPAKDAIAAQSPIDINPDKVCYIALTSGTTGQPKAVMHSDNTLLANGRAMVADWGHSADTITYCLGPMSHHLAIIGVELTLVSGCEYITNDLAKGMKPLDRILETGATYVMGVPTHAIDIQQDATTRGLERLGDVKVFYMSGSSIAPEVARRFADYGIVPQNTYGMSEGGSHTSTLRDDGHDVLVNTVGQCCGRGNPCYELKVWKANDRDILAAPGEIGELGGRGASFMLGYYANQAATETSFNRRGWFMSGDLASVDANGNITIAGRSKDIIIRGGHNIYPVEIESLALRHPDIAKVAAFPVADVRLGEKVCLAIIPAGNKNVTAHIALQHLAAEGLSRFDMPKYFISVSELPITASGKVLKRELVEKVRSGALSPEPVRYRAS